MTSQNTNKMFGSQRGVSPILATVLLLGITVVGGGLAYSLMAQGSNTAASQNIITLENAQAVKGSSHSDLTATIKNGGSTPWKKVEMTVAKSDLSEPLLYEALHENVMGCFQTDGTTAATGEADCKRLHTSKNLDNPLRSQWIAHLDITGGTAAIADKGEGISAGRKFVVSTSDQADRNTIVKKNTSVYNLITGNGTDAASNNITTGESCATSTSFTECTTLFSQLDSLGSNAGKIYCRLVEAGGDVECNVMTERKITSPIQPGQSIQIYADAFTKSVTGLNNQFVQNGDGLVVNIVAEGENGSTARYQTVIKVVGI